MPEEEKDQGAPETIEGQSGDEQSEETKEEPLTLEQVAELAKGLQKGYTITRQEMAGIRDTLQGIADSMNQQSGAEKGEDEYLTVGKLKEILTTQKEAEKEAKAEGVKQAQSYIDSTMEDLRAKGMVKSKADEDSLLQFAIAKKEVDLLKAADIWQEIQKAKEEGRKEAAKAKAQQEEGSKIGTSSKTSVLEQGGVDYAKIKKMDWYEF